jgi:hypothetical protein
LYFILTAMLVLIVFRKIGWFLSKKVFYPGPGWLVGLCAGVWGPSIAALMFFLIWMFRPGLFVEILFGWILGAYLAIPNYGLFNKNSLPESMRPRHRFISTRPLIGYLVLAAWLAFLVHRFPHR